MNVHLVEVESFRSLEFPITQKKVFMAHAAASPLPRRVAAAMASYIDRASNEGQWEYIYTETEEDTRRLAAKLIGAEPDEIALVSSTSMGLSMVASSIPWQNGDNVVVADGDFPSNIYPWLNLQGRGVKVKFIPRNCAGAVTLDDVKSRVDEHTRLVSLSSANYVTGYRIDIDAIGKYLHEKGVLFCVDAIQTLGAIPLDVKYVDFLAAGGHKWLLAPLGTGILYVKRRCIGSLVPALAGWKSVQEGKKYHEYNLCFHDSAKRLEPGGLNITGIMGLHAALELFLEADVRQIAVKLARLRRIAKLCLMKKDYDIISPFEEERSCGIISFTMPQNFIEDFHKDLDDNGFVVSLRDGLDGRKVIRLSPHFYNNEEEISRLLDRLPEC